jgi:hypothetical protein
LSAIAQTAPVTTPIIPGLGSQFPGTALIPGRIPPIVGVSILLVELCSLTLFALSAIFFSQYRSEPFAMLSTRQTSNVTD